MEVIDSNTQSICKDGESEGGGYAFTLPEQCKYQERRKINTCKSSLNCISLKCIDLSQSLFPFILLGNTIGEDRFSRKAKLHCF